MSYDNSMYDGVEFVAHDLETLRKQYERLRYERAELNRKLEALRNEVKAWRDADDSRDEERLPWKKAQAICKAMDATDTLNALE
jgi:hypothetical protein